MDTLHEGVLEDSGMDHSEIFINVLLLNLLSTCQLVISHTCILYWIVINSGLGSVREGGKG